MQVEGFIIDCPVCSNDLDCAAHPKIDHIALEAEIQDDFIGKTFDLSDYGFQDACDYYVKLRARYGAIFVPCIFNDETSKIMIHYDDSV